MGAAIPCLPPGATHTALFWPIGAPGMLEQHRGSFLQQELRTEKVLRNGVDPKS